MNIQPRLLSQKEAAEYLGLGLSSFQKKVRPSLIELSINGILRFDRNGLDEYIDELTESKRYTLQSKQAKEIKQWPKEAQDLSTKTESGISKKCSGVASFAKAVEQVRSK